MTATHGERITTGWVPGDNTIGARLALIRQSKGWTNIVRAAEVCDVPKETWRGWESGKYKNPRNYEEIVAKIAAASGCDLGWLYGGPELTGLLSLERLQSALAQGLSGPAAIALSLLGPPISGATSTTSAYRPPDISHRSPDSRPIDIGRPANNSPNGRPRAGNIGPNPSRPTRLRRGTTR